MLTILRCAVIRLAKPTGACEVIMSFKQYVTEQAEAADNFSKDFEIPSYNKEFLQKKIDKLNKAAAKLGAVPIVLTWGETFLKKLPKDRDELGFDTKNHNKYVEMIKVNVAGEAPKLQGWSFVGKLEPIAGTSEVMAKTAPGAKQLPKRYQHVDHIECEHCKINRFRKESFIVRKGRTYKQVGRSCLKDFLGHVDPKQYAQYAEALYNIDSIVAEADDEREYSGRGELMVSTVQAVAKAMVVIRAEGFRSKQYSGEPTSGRLYSAFFPPLMAGKERIEAVLIHQTPADEKNAKEMIKHVTEKWINSSNEFEINSAKILKGEVVSPKNFGYLAAAVNTYMKAMGDVAAKKAAASDVKDEHIGKIDEKHQMKAVVLSAHTYQGQSYSYYHSGLKAIVMFKTESGHIVKMFTSNTALAKGDKVVISGKIGRHEIESYDKSPFKGMKITIMASGSRVALDVPPMKVGDTVNLHLDNGNDVVGTLDTYNKKTGEVSVFEPKSAMIVYGHASKITR